MEAGGIQTIKFWAEWCGPCRVLKKQLEGLDMTNVNVDEDQDGLSVNHKVRQLPTIVFLKDDVEVHRQVGLITRQAYLDVLETLK